MNNLQRLNKKGITVTDIASQFWCERQMELNALKGREYNVAMAKGSAVHKELQMQVYRQLDAKPSTYADSMYKAAYENNLSMHSLVGKGICREFKVYGSINGYRIAGKIDEMRIRDGGIEIVENKTTRKGNSLSEASTRPHRMQAMLYIRLMKDMMSGTYAYENFERSYGIERLALSEKFRMDLAALGIPEADASISAVCRKMFDNARGLPEVRNDAMIRYISSEGEGREIQSEVRVPYSEADFSEKIGHAMGYWNGDREAEPVAKDESWKCGFCRFFGKECTVWWRGA
jgi:exonuclease V